MLSIMAKDFFSESPLLLFPVAALFIFIAIFTVVTIRVLRTEKEALQVVAVLPLADDLFSKEDLAKEAKQ
jgi:hypothetical protein